MAAVVSDHRLVGGYTTFSAFSVDAALIAVNSWALSLNVLLSVAGALAGVAVGLFVARRAMSGGPRGPSGITLARASYKPDILVIYTSDEMPSGGVRALFVDGAVVQTHKPAMTLRQRTRRQRSRRRNENPGPSRTGVSAWWFWLSVSAALAAFAFATSISLLSALAGLLRLLSVAVTLLSALTRLLPLLVLLLAIVLLSPLRGILVLCHLILPGLHTSQPTVFH